jgi:hypothetical protein
VKDKIKRLWHWYARAMSVTGENNYGLAGEYIDPATMADPVVYAHRTPEDAVQRGTNALRNMNDMLDAFEALDPKDSK